MANVRLGENVGIGEEVIKKACSMAMKAHKSPEKLYLSDKIRCSSSEGPLEKHVFSFPGSWLVSDWVKKGPFGIVGVDLQVFPSLRYLGLNEIATVNEAFLQRFKAVLAYPQFRNEVERAVRDGKQVVFTGHSLGGPIAILATIWFLEVFIRPAPNNAKPLCVTFGSPLVGDHIMNHALRRENWSRYFIHFVMRYDIIPRISLTPLSCIENQLQQVLNFINPKYPSYKQGPMLEASNFYVTVLRNASSVASHAACKIMGNTNVMLETLSNIVELSPYRPFGTYIFCTGNQKLVIVKNPDAVLQLLFYSAQLRSTAEREEVAQRSLKDHLNYKNELQDSLEMQSATFLDSHHLEALPLSWDGANANNATISIALNDLGLSTRARLCLHATEELEKQKKRNQDAIDKKKKDIERGLDKLEGYKNKCALLKVGYYDAFKISREKDDFEANVTRLELAGIWDEIVEMLKRYELPDGFESHKAWIELGTRYRWIVEPLDIANYYRHLKNEDTGPYMKRGRPKRYKCTQRWREHGRMMTNESLESCFWAEVEELCLNSQSFGIKDHIVLLLNQARTWILHKDLGEDVLLEASTFTKLLKEHNLFNSVQDLAFQ